MKHFWLSICMILVYASNFSMDFRFLHDALMIYPIAENSFHIRSSILNSCVYLNTFFNNQEIAIIYKQLVARILEILSQRKNAVHHLKKSPKDIPVEFDEKIRSLLDYFFKKKLGFFGDKTPEISNLRLMDSIIKAIVELKIPLLTHYFILYQELLYIHFYMHHADTRNVASKIKKLLIPDTSLFKNKLVNQKMEGIDLNKAICRLVNCDGTLTYSKSDNGDYEIFNIITDEKITLESSNYINNWQWSKSNPRILVGRIPIYSNQTLFSFWDALTGQFLDEIIVSYEINTMQLWSVINDRMIGFVHDMNKQVILADRCTKQLRVNHFAFSISRFAFNKECSKVAVIARDFINNSYVIVKDVKTGIVLECKKDDNDELFWIDDVVITVPLGDHHFTHRFIHSYNLNGEVNSQCLKAGVVINALQSIDPKILQFVVYPDTCELWNIEKLEKICHIRVPGNVILGRFNPSTKGLMVLHRDDDCGEEKVFSYNLASLCNVHDYLNDQLTYSESIVLDEIVKNTNKLQLSDVEKQILRTCAPHDQMTRAHIHSALAQVLLERKDRQEEEQKEMSRLLGWFFP